MELAEILSDDSVLVLDKAADKAELFGILSERAAVVTGLDAETIYEALTAREALGSTGLGSGIAIPHGKLTGLDRVHALFVRLLQPMEFEAIDDEKVDLVVTLLAPVGAGADHLKALARVARLLRTESLVKSLRSTTDPARLHEILTVSLSSQNAA
jgi:PTS system nitrogen regulatory IIA component